MTRISSSFQMTGAFLQTDTDEAVADTLAPIRTWFAGRPQSLRRAIGTCHSERYVRQQMAGERDLPLSVWERILLASPREVAAASLRALARRIGYDLVEIATPTTHDVRAEVYEAHDATSRAFVIVSDAIADGIVTPAERLQIETAVTKAQRELSDVMTAVAMTGRVA